MITVILPTYNEADNIALLISAIQKNIPSNADILVVDDNSPDGTAARVKTNRHVKLIVRTKNRGLTNSVNEGITASKGDVILWMDCDFSHPPSVIPKLLKEIERGADIALASRVRNRGLSVLVNTVAMAFFGRNITDYTTGFLAVRRTVLDRIPLLGDYGEYCIDLLVRAQAAGYRIEEIPYISPPRRSGYSKTSLRFGYGYLITVLRLLWTSGK
ncbi:hypothetical protein A2875_01550 [Candidatus Gottesmanbacteria bacterium RIFCSPHIGHO2_01_FULL_46_14]|uniref:Glycosyltransferase 2-like domain-containing protein n=2 Tax=Candidatus Gottesmaniibacteriota TaxID=1752720 RepID=A0A1F5ZKL4_9BACT|nr:MAG: hypothetical protein A2875_01550 [Candidatus Gottesmanbacteria bacterium RIFCSPHIGHO2_01_FULL_46_14]OGG28899.1 MAG: hypothetical protein A2971_05060 [Candidatus Gottesmanbacteria bacterium RIFCSPLOWO2_01_FULL_46_21]